MKNHPCRIAILLALLHLIIMVCLALPGLINPVFGFDAGYRLLRLDTLLVENGGRVWLPLLQMHLVMLRSLGASVTMVQLLPVFYCCLFIFSWSYTLLKDAQPTALRVFLITLSSFFLMTTPIMHWLSIQPYQEPLMLGLAWLLAAAVATKQPTAVVVGIAALAGLSREYVWILAGPGLLLWLSNSGYKAQGRAAAVTLCLAAGLWRIFIDDIPSHPAAVSSWEYITGMVGKFGYRAAALVGAIVALSIGIAHKNNIQGKEGAFSIYTGLLVLGSTSAYIIVYTPFVPVDNARAFFPLVFGLTFILWGIIYSLDRTSAGKIHWLHVLVILVLLYGSKINLEHAGYSGPNYKLEGTRMLQELAHSGQQLCSDLPQDIVFSFIAPNLFDALEDRSLMPLNRNRHLCEVIITAAGASDNQYELPQGVSFGLLNGSAARIKGERSL